MKSGFIIIFCLVVCNFSIKAQTKGSLSVNVTTKSTGLPGKNYAPKNSMVIWVEDESHNFVKTLLVNAQARRMALKNWEASTKSTGRTFNAADAITGATNNNHGTRSCDWDGTDFSGKIMPDGNYILHMELTDLDAAGHLSEFNFSKGPDPVKLSPGDQPSFTSVSINWIPD